MSDLNKVARPYAKAVFELAAKSKKLVEWEQRLSVLAQISMVSDMQRALMNPGLGKSFKQDLILEAANLKGDKDAEGLLAELSYQNRLGFLSAIYDLFLAYKNQHDGTIAVELRSAFAMDEKQIQTLRTALEKKYNKQMELEVKQDSNLIGGVVIRVGDMIIDHSLQGRLRKLAEALQKQ